MISRILLTILVFFICTICTQAIYAAEEESIPAETISKHDQGVTTPIEFAKEKKLQFRESDDVGLSLFFNILLTVGFLTLMLYIVLFVLKKYGLLGLPKDDEGKSEIRTLSVKRLAGKTLLFVVEIEGQRFMICQNDHAIKLEKLEPSQSSPNID